MSIMHKHCYDMKAQTDNAEHINDNRFSILLLWVKNSNNKDNNALEKISTFRNSANYELIYALYKRSCYTIVKREQSPNSILKRQNSKLQVSFALWLAFMWHILD